MPVPMWGKMLQGTAFAVVLAWVGPAVAADPQKIAADLVAAMNAGGEVTASFTSATASGADVTISGVQLVGGADMGTAEIGTLIVVNPVDRSPGGFTADRISLGNGRVTGLPEEGNLSWATGEMTGITVMTPAELEDQPEFLPFSSMVVEGITFSDEDDEIPVARVDISVGDIVDGTPVSGAVFVTGLGVPDSMLSELGLDAMLSEFGMTELIVSFGLDAAYNRASDELDVRTLTIEAQDLGKIDIATKLSGVPLSALTEEEPDALLATGKLDSLSFHFENSGLVEQVLDAQARETGLNREQLVTQLTGAMPFMLGFLGDPDLQTRIGDAASAFLANPQNFTITATPSSPLPLAALIQAANEAPASILGLLSIGVSAND